MDIIDQRGVIRKVGVRYDPPMIGIEAYKEDLEEQTEFFEQSLIDVNGFVGPEELKSQSSFFDEVSFEQLDRLINLVKSHQESVKTTKNNDEDQVETPRMTALPSLSPKQLKHDISEEQGNQGYQNEHQEEENVYEEEEFEISEGEEEYFGGDQDSAEDEDFFG